MAVNAVSPAAGGVQPQYADKVTREQEPVRPRESSRESSRAETAQRLERQATQERRAEQAKSDQRTESQKRPKPVVNAQGQKTGSIINTTA